jgi:hypothetical protein
VLFNSSCVLGLNDNMWFYTPFTGVWVWASGSGANNSVPRFPNNTREVGTPGTLYYHELPLFYTFLLPLYPSVFSLFICVISGPIVAASVWTDPDGVRLWMFAGSVEDIFGGFPSTLSPLFLPFLSYFFSSTLYVFCK